MIKLAEDVKVDVAKKDVFFYECSECGKLMSSPFRESLLNNIRIHLMYSSMSKEEIDDEVERVRKKLREIRGD